MPSARSTSTTWKLSKVLPKRHSELNSPAILQVSAGARKYANHVYLVKLVEAAIAEHRGCPSLCIWITAGF